MTELFVLNECLLEQIGLCFARFLALVSIQIKKYLRN